MFYLHEVLAKVSAEFFWGVCVYVLGWEGDGQ